MRRCVRELLAVLIALLAIPAGAAEQPLRFGVVSFYNPRIMYLKYQPLVDYLAEQTKQPWELVISPSYEDTVQALCNGTLSMAYLGPLTYVRAHEQCGALPVVRLATDGNSTYSSVIMVRRDATINDLRELSGRSFGFGSPLSTSSHLVPRAMLEEVGLRLGENLRCVYFGHHERAARSVLLGEVDACGIRDIVGRRFEERGLRVLARSQSIPNFPLVLAPQVDGWLRGPITRALVVLPASQEGIRQTILAWDEELAAGFAIGRDEDFDGIRALGRKVFGPYFLTIPEERLRCGSQE